MSSIQMRFGFSFGVHPDPTLNLSSTFPDLTDVYYLHHFGMNLLAK